MEFTSIVIVTISLFSAIAFLSTRKRGHPLKHMFLLLLLEFILTSIEAVISDNVSYWSVSEESNKFWTFRSFQIILAPFLILWTLELIDWVESKTVKVVIVITSIFTLFFIEQALVYLEIVMYKQWSWEWSILLWGSVVAISILTKWAFRSLLKKEGEIS